jgi:predicted nucleotide-binding protein
MSSEWIIRELEHALEHGVRILPILLRPTPLIALPARLQTIQWLDISRHPKRSVANFAAGEIAKVLLDWSTTVDTLKEDEREDLAKAFTAQASGTSKRSQVGTPPDSVFIVHGHDDEFLGLVVDFISDLGVKPIVMKEIGGAAVSLIQKFFEVGGAAQFAIVLLSADDMGASRIQYEHPRGGDRALKYRSRQNVILELGYFYGLLGWDKVFVLERAAPESVPDFERPSDLNGVLFDKFDELGKWKSFISNRLKSSGFRI